MSKDSLYRQSEMKGHVHMITWVGYEAATL